MSFQPYHRPVGLHNISANQLDLRPDSEIDHALLHPKPVTDEKNIWFFWHTGYKHMHPYTKRNVRSWHRRFSRQGWTIRVLDGQPDSPLNISHFLKVTDPTLFPKAFTANTLSGTYALQHASDLVRFPLLLKYGGVYSDVGMIQIGDLDRLWHQTVANPASPFEVLSYNCEGVQTLSLANYFLAARRNNPFFERCHRLLLKLWQGKSSTEGMCHHPLVKGVPLMTPSMTFEEHGKTFSAEEVSEMLTDYIIQGHVISMVMGLVDEEGGWNGPEYVAKHIYGIDYMVGSQLINEMTAWDGRRAFELMSLSLPKEGEEETADQKQAREIVEACLSRSYGFKLAHGLILRVFGDTLGSLWRKHEGSDNVRNTYAHWLRYGVVHWSQDELPSPKPFKVLEPYKIGPLLQER
ncbi:hypothetical protein AJ80_05076 [Polytolypa hystricis UAMH7299]|uniref:Capsule polysaccharide biosynthesis protein n=1 Tax=Polytolypa hystricis (strain UAMH7299) TaxID=1447883 RepID=A0A2B7Y6U7_POLH7|nr:hypothetical protein AJ80_05076 [Polytolypa hystricis UAMH7299]